MVAPQEALAAVPDALASTAAAPLLCAGVTTFNSLRNSGARAGDLVAVQAIGGRAPGHPVRAQAGLPHRGPLAGRGQARPRPRAGRPRIQRHRRGRPGGGLAKARRRQGAARHRAQCPAHRQARRRTRPQRNAVVLGATPEPIQISPFQLIGARRRIQGWPSGTAKDSEETLAFSALSGVASRNEIFPLEKAQEAYQRMLINKARFRVVLQVR